MSARGSYKPRAGSPAAKAEQELAALITERRAARDAQYRAALGLTNVTPLPSLLGAASRMSRPAPRRRPAMSG